MRSTLTVALCLVLAACGGNSETAEETAATEVLPTPGATPPVGEFADTVLVVDANGVGAKGQDIFRFGSDRATVDAGLAEAFGSEPEKGENFDCGAGPMQFSNYGPLQVAYQDGKLSGWFLREGEGMTTSDGVRPGTTTLALLKEERPLRELESTLPGEFEYTSADYGTIGGFSEDGVVTSLHAGMTCFFR